MNIPGMRAPWYRRALAQPKRVWPELAAVAAVGLLYARTLGYGLVFDDHSLIGPDGPRFLGNEWLPYRPLRYASLWIDAVAGGGAAWAYHAGNLVLHAAAVVLVVRLARRSAPAPLALLAGLVLALHPLAVESVAYVAGRRDLLVAVCGIAAVLAWTSPTGHGALALLLVVLATAAKESGILLVPVLAAASACGLGAPLVRARLPLTLTAVAVVLLPAAYGATGPLAPRGDPATRLVVVGTLAAHYGAGVAGTRELSAEYPELRCLEEDCRRLSRPRAAVGLAGLAALALAAAALAARTRRRGGGPGGRWRAFAMVWLALWALAVSAVVGAHEPGADRHAYPMLAALALLLAAAAASLPPAARRTATAALGVWLVLLGVATSERIPVWRSDRDLWQATVRTAPGSARAHHNLAAVHASNGRPGLARRELARALAIDERYWPAYTAHAILDCEHGRLHSAAARLGRAVALGAPAESIAAVERRCAQAANARD